jgi:hypothetical protein
MSEERRMGEEGRLMVAGGVVPGERGGTIRVEETA